MFITAAKAMFMEALAAGYNAINDNAPTYEPVGPDLRPHEICIEFPLASEQWPALLIQFHPSLVRATGLNPEIYTQPSGPEYGQPVGSMVTYFEGYWDMTVYSLTSQERDRLWDGIMNMILLNPVSPGSQAFYNKINNYDLIQATLLPSMIQPIGDTIGPGVPWNEELLLYEATIRAHGLGTYSNPYQINEPAIERIIITGTDTYGNSRSTDIT